MAFNINTKKIEKPASSYDTLPDGVYDVEIEKSEYTTSTNQNQMLKIVYKTTSTPAGRLIFDQIMDDPNIQVNAYRLSRLLAALGINLEGEVELRDLTKVLTKGKKLKIAVITNEKTKFTNIDITNHEGYYPSETKATAQLDAASPDLSKVDNDVETVEITNTDEEY